MFSYLIRRILILIPMVLLISFLIFLGLELMPGDAVSHMLDPEAIAHMTPEKLHELRESLGLNEPFLFRFFHWLAQVLRGNFGYSLSSGVAIKAIVFDRLPATLELALTALFFSTLLGTALGVYSALKKGSLGDNFLTVLGMLGVSIPQFFFALSALLIFSLRLNLLPVGGRLLPGYQTFWDRLPHLLLPAFVLGSTMTAGVMRYSRASMLDSLNKEFMKTARSKGLPEWRVYLYHGFRNALIPVVVLIGFRLPMLIGGAVVIERIFQWPGLGNEFLVAVRGQNYPLVMMIALFSVMAVLISSFMIDIFTALLDPRVRLR